MMRHGNKIGLGLMLIFSCMFLTTGCESLRRKFTRQKKGPEHEEVMIITPRNYSEHPFPNDVLYKQYFIYWKSWNQELVSSLNDMSSYKKIVDCAEQAVINLKKMASYLNEEKAKELGVYIQKTQDLEAKIIETQSMPPSRLNLLRYDAERILNTVNRKYDLTRMKAFLK